MFVHVKCKHGHPLQVLSGDQQRVVCPLCGSVVLLKLTNPSTEKTAPYAPQAGGPAIPAGEVMTSLESGWVETASGNLGSPTDTAPVITRMSGTAANAADETLFLAVPGPAEGEEAGVGPTAFQGEHGETTGPGGAGPADGAVTKVAARNQQANLPSLRTTEPMRIDIEVTEPPDLPGFTVIRELGRGGMGVVYEARDEKLNRVVALKTLQRISPQTLKRFKQEFRTLTNISHPNLAGPYDLLSDGKSWCFTMELLDSVDFLEFVWSGFAKLNQASPPQLVATATKAGPRLSLAVLHRLHEGLKQLAIGLNALHEAGVLHRDVKPSNILVTRAGRLVLVDFGLATEMEREGQPRGIHGTPDYMSPEQAVCGRMTPASDWYAVGVMLYEVLTGMLPFRGTMMQLLQKKQHETPTEPRTIEPSVPQELNDLCMALLDLDATKRPGAAELLDRIGAGEEAAVVSAPSRHGTTQTELVGRERHLEVLHDVFGMVAAGATRSVFVYGRSGTGKSVLIHAFLEEIRARGQAVVLTGRCYEQESVPFKALDSLIDSLAEYLGMQPPETIRRALPEDSLPLVRLFPVIGQLPGTIDAGKPPIDNVDQQELRQRAMNALRMVLAWMTERSPVVLYIEDLQWGDVDSAILLADLVRPPNSPPVMLLVSYRGEDVASSQCLKAMAKAFATGQHHPHRQELAVEALGEHDATRLALMLLDRDDPAAQALAAKIARESAGLPFFVWELVQHVQDDPLIADQNLALEEVIWNRVNRLPEDTRQLLELIAVAGQPLVVAEAYQALDSGDKGQGLLVQLRSRNLIRMTEMDDRATIVEPYHDRIRESIVAHLETRKCNRISLRLAETILKISGMSAENVMAHLVGSPPFEEPTGLFQLDRQQWRRVFELAGFFGAAGEHGRALPYALIAAEQARRQNALEVAEQQYRIALLGSGTSTPALRFRILEGLGDVLILRGSYDAANEQLQAARDLAPNDITRARIDGKLGRSSLQKGDMGDAVVYLEKALTALRERPPGSLPTLLPRLAKEGIVQMLHTLLPSRLVGRRRSDGPEGRTDLFRVRLLDDLTIAYWFSRTMELVLWAHLRQMNLAERYPPTQELGRTYAFHAITMSAIPLARRGIEYAQRSHRISVEAGDLWGQGKARSYHTFSCIVLARFEEGLRTGAEAVRLLEEAGDVWESNMARMIATVPMYHLGDLKTASREAKKAYEIGLETGDYSAVCIALLFWIPCAPHLIPPGAIQKELARDREDPLSIAGAVYARGLELLLCEDNPAEAAHVLQESLDRARKRGLRNVCIFSAASWKATALRMVAERAPKGQERKRAVKAARRACREALRMTRSYQACRPHALRESGIVAVLEGSEAAARRLFDESLAVADRHGARYEHAKTSRARGEAGMHFGWDGAARQAAEATALVRELENVTGP